MAGCRESISTSGDSFSFFSLLRTRCYPAKFSTNRNPVNQTRDLTSFARGTPLSTTHLALTIKALPLPVRPSRTSIFLIGSLPTPPATSEGHITKIVCEHPLVRFLICICGAFPSAKAARNEVTLAVHICMGNVCLVWFGVA
jgi:hypothetical protein